MNGEGTQQSEGKDQQTWRERFELSANVWAVLEPIMVALGSSFLSCC